MKKVKKVKQYKVTMDDLMKLCAATMTQAFQQSLESPALLVQDWVKDRVIPYDEKEFVDEIKKIFKDKEIK